MRAAVMREQSIVVDEIPAPEPGPGQVLVRTLACGICGSDLHMLRHGARLAREVGVEALMPGMDFARDVVMGHEFVAEILDYGAGTERRLKVGTAVTSVPVVLGPGWRRTVGYCNDYPGGYGERMVLNEVLLLALPSDLPTHLAALTEPMAVGLHAVRKAQLGGGEVALVIGCGPVGLAVVAALKLDGHGPIVAADYSPARRRLAEAMGAHVVVDPAQQSAFESWREHARIDPPGEPPALGPAFEALKPAVIFECVGVPGVIEGILAAAPRGARIVIAGVCMESDHFRPFHGIVKEISMQFVLGYSSEEFAQSLGHIADGRFDVEPLVTARIPLSAVADAFRDLAHPDAQAKILIEP